VKVTDKRVPLLVVACAAVVLAAPFLGTADAGHSSKHRKKPKTLVGKYKGSTEEGGTVSFRVTSNAKIVGFTLTNAKLFCLTDQSRGSIPTFEPEYTKPLAVIKHTGPIRLRGVSKKFPLSGEFEVGGPGPENAAREAGKFTGEVADLTSTPTGGIVLPGKGFHGEVEFETANGPTPFPSSQNPTPEWRPGTEWCVTRTIDWDAKRPRDRGFVFA
jgi:hypothetical protein